MMVVMVPVVFVAVFMTVLVMSMVMMVFVMFVYVFHFFVLFDLVFQFAKLLTFQNTALSPLLVKANRHHRRLPMVPV